MCPATPMARRSVSGLLVVLLLLPACTSTRLSHRYVPRPADLPAVGEAGVAAARVLVSVLAVERFGERAEEPWGVSLRLRLENHGERTLTLRRDDLLLVDASLTPCDPPWPDQAPATVAAGDWAGLDLWFPLPGGADPGDMDLEGLSLRLTLDDGQARRTLSAGFERVRRPRSYPPGWTAVHWGYGPRWGPGWGPGFGTVIVW